MKQYAYPTGTDAPSRRTHFRDFVSEKSQAIALLPQQLYVAFTIVSKGKAAAEIDFFRMQTIYDNVAQKILRVNLCECLIKMNNDGLFYAQHAQGFDFLIESLQQRRSGFGVQHGPRVRLERDHRRHSADRARPLDYCLHDELMPQMQTVKHTQGQDGRAGDLGVVGTVK